MKFYIYILFFLISIVLKTKAQKEQTIIFEEKKYKVYTSLEQANKVNPDSVAGIQLNGKGLKDFPKELLKFRNLRYLDLSCFYWSQVPELLTKEERKTLEVATKTRGKELENIYKQNVIKKIPNEIDRLEKLEIINISLCSIKLKDVKKLTELLPKTKIVPSYETLKGLEKLKKEYD